MDTFWRKCLDGIYNNFLSDLKIMNDYCELCEVSFNQGRLPNYRSRPQQNLYLLRYFSAYLFEYHFAFSELAKTNFLGDIPRIASIGCGSGIDGAAVDHVFNDYTYRGIDCIRWDTWFAEETPCIGDAINYIPISENTFVFPKSLGELPLNVIEALARNLPKTSAKKVCIINSRRSADTCWDGCEKILEGFGLSPLTVSTSTHIGPCNQEKTGLGLYHPWFSYPQHIIDTITQLSRSCPARELCPKAQNPDAPCPRHGHNRPCRGENIPMQRWPVTSDSNFCTDIYLIERT